MNAELILTVLSLLGDIPMPPQGHEAPPKLEAVYASWQNPVQIQYGCPDQSSGIDPMGQDMFVGKSVTTEDGTAFAAAAIKVYPTPKLCQKEAMEPHHSIFPSMLDAGEFRLACKDGDCRDWHARAASEEEVVDYALTKRQWQVTHYPGGDADKYPNGVFEIYSRAERSFDKPLGTGPTALIAIADALNGAKP